MAKFNGETCDAANYDKEKIHHLLGSSGSIAVQVHGGTGWPNGAKCRWKNVRIKPM